MRLEVTPENINFEIRIQLPFCNVGEISAVWCVLFSLRKILCMYVTMNINIIIETYQLRLWSVK